MTRPTIIPLLTASRVSQLPDALFSQELHRSMVDLGGFAQLNFEPAEDGGMQIARYESVAADSFIEMTPVKLENSRWLSIEFPLDVDTLLRSEILTPLITMSADRTMMVFAALRIGFDDDLWQDIASCELTVGKTPRTNAFPLPLTDDSTEAAISRAKWVKLILFVEHRFVRFCLFDCRMITVPTDEALFKSRVSALLSKAFLQMKGRRYEVALSQELVRLEDGSHRIFLEDRYELAPSVFVCIEADLGFETSARSTNGRLLLDVSDALGSAWRTLEFRMPTGEIPDAVAISVLDLYSVGHEAIEFVIRYYAGDEIQDHLVSLISLTDRADVSHEVFRVPPPRDLIPTGVGMFFFLPRSHRLLGFSRFTVTALYDFFHVDGSIRKA